MQALNPPPSNKEGDSITPGIVSDGREVTPSFQRRVDSQDLPIQIPEKPIIDGDEIMDDKSVPFTIYDNDNVFIGLKYRRRIIATFMVVILVMFTGGGYIVSWVFKDRDISPDPLTAISSDKLQGITEQQTGETNELAVNSPLHINNRLIVAPSAPPTTSPSQAGEIYFNADTKQFVYYDGDSYQTVVNGQDLSQLSSVGRANTGAGLNLAAGVLSNGGVLSIQGSSGNVSFLAGNGISLNGLTVTNTGVTSVTGTASQIVVSAANGSVQFSLPQDIALTSNVTFNQMTLGMNGSSSGKVVFRGGTSNSVTLQAPVSPTNGLTFTLPVADGASGECLRTNGSGVLSFSSCMESGTFINNGITLQTGNFAIQSADATYTGAVIRAATSQSADLFQLQNSSGTVLTSFSKDGRLNFSGDTSLYRSGVNSLSSAGSLTLGGSLTAVGSLNVIRVSDTASILNGKVNGDMFNRYQVTADGTTEWGDGTNAADTSLYRSAAGTLSLQGSGSSVSLQAASATGADTGGINLILAGGAGNGAGNGGDINLQVATASASINQNFISSVTSIWGTAVDSTYVYWTTRQGFIGRANLDGTGINRNFIDLSGLPNYDLRNIAVDGSYIYWINSTSKAIGRANLDGSGVDNNFIATASNPGGIAVNNSYVYWGQNTGIIGRANLDGTGVNQSFITGAGGVNVALDIEIDANFIYWPSSTTIGRANLDGSGVDNNFITTGNLNNRGVGVDNTHIYWTSNNSNTIGRANLDGSGINTNFVVGAFAPQSIVASVDYLFWSNNTSSSIGRSALNGTVPNSPQTVLSFSGANGAALFKNAVDSTTALQIQNAAGTALLTIDTVSSKIGIGTAPSSSLGALQLAAGTTQAGGITFGTDTNLYRLQADILRTDDRFSVRRSANTDVALQVGYGSADYAYWRADGQFWFGGGSGYDTNLYRSAGGNLKTDNTLEVVGNLYALTGSTSRVVVGNQGPTGEAGIKFGSTGDTNLYRSAADTLKTDDKLVVGGQLTAGGLLNSTGAAIFQRTNETDRALDVQTLSDANARLRIYAKGRLSFGDGTNVQDTNMYRSAAGTLTLESTTTTSATLQAVDGLGADANGQSLNLNGGAGTGTGNGGNINLQIAPPTLSANQSFITGLANVQGTAVDTNYVYWTSSPTSIGRANLDGSNKNTTFITGLSTPTSVAVNGSYVYWSNSATNTIGRANLDGTSVNNSFISTSGSLRGLTINGAYIYWVNTTTIGRANLDGTSVNNSFISSGTSVSGVAVDGTYIYWTRTGGQIGRANLDGTSVNTGFISGLSGSPMGIVATSTKLYWANQTGNTIGRANLDGTSVNNSLITGASTPTYPAANGSYLYWSNYGGSVGRALINSATTNSPLTVVTLSGTNGAALFKNAVDSTTALQIQNAAGTSNLFVADTANTRIGLGAAPATSLLTIGTNTTTASGGITFGTDTNLYRSGADVLRTDDTLSVAGTFYLYNSVSSNNQVSISNGGANTTFSHLNNTPAGRLILMSKGSTTSGIRLTVGSAGNIEFFADTTSVGKITSAGQLQLPIQGSGAGLLIGDDVNLYRETANYLRTDNNFKAIGGVYSGADIMARQGSANRVTIGQVGPASQAGIRLSSSEDTLLYRSAAGALMVQGANTATDSTLIVKGLGTQVADLFQLQNSSGTVLTSFDKDGRLVFGTDTNIYRSAAGRLKTDGQLEINAGATPGVDTRYIEVSNTSNSRRIGLGLFADGTVGVISNDRLYLQGNTSNSGVAIRPSSTGSQFNFSNINSQNGQLSISGSGSILTLQQASANQKVRLSDGVVLEFGSAGDTNIYRSAADTLKTDDNLIVASNFTANGTALFQKSSNSTTAFQIQNSAGAGVFTADTINSIIKLGDATNTDLTAWQTNANALPSARKTAASITANGYIYIMGGSDGASTQSTVYYAKLNADGSTSSWTTNPNNLPAVRQNLTAATANGYVYAIGGYDGTNTKNTVYYAKLNADGSTSSWTTTTLPANRSLASAVTANGYLYVVSGEDDTNGLQSVLYAKLNADGTLGAWTTDTNIPSITDAAAAVVLNGYLYVVGGFSGGTYSHDILYAKLNPLDGSIGSWTTVNQGGLTLPADIDYHTVTAMNGTIYVFGGWDGSTVQDKVYYTKPSSTNGSINGWSTSANNLPDARRQHTTVTANGYVYVLGGDNSGAKSTIYYSSIQRVQIAGVLDLVGPGSGNLAESGSGGSLTAGNTDILGQLAVRESTNIQQNLSVGGNFLVGGSVLFKNATDTTTAFQVQNAAGTTLLLADTSNMIINVMGDTTAFASLALTNAHFRSVQTNAPTIATPTNCGTSPAASIKADSTDSAGAFSVTAGSGSPSTCDTTITFNKTYGAAPKSILVVAQSQDGGTGTAAARQIYVSSTTATNFTVKMNSTPATSEVDWYYYWVVE